MSVKESVRLRLGMLHCGADMTFSAAVAAVGYGQSRESCHYFCTIAIRGSRYERLVQSGVSHVRFVTVQRAR
jgi:hypothetical protein